MEKEQPTESGLSGAAQVSAIVSRCAVDKQFNDALTSALEAGDGNKVVELLDPMGIKEVDITFKKGAPAIVNLRISITICVTVTVCVRF